jgi:arginine utilization protein RocB
MINKGEVPIMESRMDQIKEIMINLVKQKSVVNTEGEKDLAIYIYDYLKSLPYFDERSNQLRLVKTDEANQERYSCVALLQGNQAKNDTVILMGHIDTVGIDDFGKDQDLALDPENWMERMKSMDGIPPEVKKAVDTGEWFFGRGTVDMKSAVAINLYLIKYFSEHPEELNGNILLVAECDEEDGSHGILSSIYEINRMAEEFNLNYVAAINSDYTTARHDQDENRYIYLGTVGKLLPSFFVTGLETHVGEAFSGFDPNLVMSELTKEIDYNTDLCDEWEGEITVPPVSLKQQDMKPFYDVQTPLAAFSYFNFLVHSWSPKEVLKRLKAHGEKAFSRAISTYQERLESYNKKAGFAHNPLNLKPRVYFYDEYYDLIASNYGEAFKKSMNEFMEEIKKEDLDIRFYCCRVVEELCRWDDEKQPTMIIFYSSLYSPRILLDEKKAEDRRLIEAVNLAVQKIQPVYKKPIKVRKFYPYISDMSFVSLSDQDEEIESYKRNMPAWGRGLYVPFEEIRKLDVPIINIGPYGFDAHKKWERLEINYSLNIVPKLIVETVQNLLKDIKYL